TIGHQTPKTSPVSIRSALPRSRITPTPRMIPPKKTRPQFMFPTVLGTRYSLPGKSQEKEEAPAEPGPFEVPGTRYGVGRRPARSVLDVEGADGAAPLGDGGLVLHQLGEVAGDLDLAGHESHLGVHLTLGDGGGGVVGLLDGHVGRFETAEGHGGLAVLGREVVVDRPVGAVLGLELDTEAGGADGVLPAVVLVEHAGDIGGPLFG